ncbi:MAG: hypothetical protein HY367_01905 [Candidatus Aenigmarchaeota archaeon]|nr:hypothetical protein [Candidatus Aenigmarchaeota archaeon]
MGLNIFRRKAEPAHASEQVHIGELMGWFIRNNSGRMEAAKAQSHKLATEIKSSFLAVGSSLVAIERISVEKDAKLDATIKTIKGPYISKARNIISRLPSLAMDPAYQDMQDFYNKSRASYAELSGMPPKLFFVLTSMFDREGSRLAAGMKALENSLSSFSGFLQGESVVIQTHGEIMSGLTARESLMSEMQELSSVESAIRSKMEALSAELQAARTEMDKLSSGEEAKEHESISRQLAEIKSSISDARGRLSVSLGSIRKAIERASYGAQTPEIKSYLRDPLEAFMANEDGIAQAIADLLNSASIRQKDRQKLEQFLLSLGALAEAKKYYTSLCVTGKNMERQLASSGHAENRRRLEGRIEYLEKATARLVEELDSASSRKAALQDKAVGITKNLSSAVSRATGWQVDVVS